MPLLRNPYHERDAADDDNGCRCPLSRPTSNRKQRSLVGANRGTAVTRAAAAPLPLLLLPLMMLLSSLLATASLLLLRGPSSHAGTTARHLQHSPPAETTMENQNAINRTVQHPRGHLNPRQQLPQLMKRSSTGRLGNQMFEYASTIGIAREARGGADNNLDVCIYGGNSDLLRRYFVGPIGVCHGDDDANDSSRNGSKNALATLKKHLLGFGHAIGLASEAPPLADVLWDEEDQGGGEYAIYHDVNVKSLSDAAESASMSMDRQKQGGNTAVGAGTDYWSQLQSQSQSKEFTAINKDAEIRGYLQSWRYFEHSEDEVRRVFRFREEYMSQAHAFLEPYLSGSKEGDAVVTVGVHVRRGDVALRWSYVMSPGASFYGKAMEYFRSCYNRQNSGSDSSDAVVRFVVVSDDVRWCQSQPSFHADDVTFAPGLDAGVDLAILSGTDHAIIQGGTYGWWGAYLGAHGRGSGEVIYYDGFFDMRHWKNEGKVRLEDYFPPGWKAMSDVD